VPIPMPEKTQEKPEPEPEPESEIQPPELATIDPVQPTLPSEPTHEPDTEPAPVPAHEPLLPIISTDIIRHQILTNLRQAEQERSLPDRSTTLEPFSVPRLPASAGWINDHVGPVAPQSDRWVENDGSRASRHVLASGQVICGRTRPPTMNELFNPSMSVNIMTFYTCGRERPVPVDREDPWIRVPSTQTRADTSP
jgi:hypothetical protein